MANTRRRTARVGARIGGTAVVAATLAGCWWPQSGAGPDRRAHNSAEEAITASTVAGLHELWSVPTDGPAGDPVTSVAGVHVEGTDLVYGVRTDGTALWSVPVPSDLNPAYDIDFTSVLVDGGSVLAGHDSAEPTLWWDREIEAGRWLDAATGAVLAGGIGADGVRDGLMAGTTTQYAEGYHTEMLQIADVATGEVLVDDMISMQHESSELLVESHVTLGAAAVFQAGPGLAQAPAWERPFAFGVRSFPRTGAQTGCGPGENANWFVCATWTTELAGVSATAVVVSADQSTLYVGVDSTLHVLDAVSGDVVWAAPLGSAIAAAPAVGQGRVVVATADGTLAVLPADGCGASVCSPTWSGSTGAPISVQPAIAGSGSSAVVVSGGVDGGLDAFRVTGCGAATCAPLWSGSAGARVTGAPAVSGGQVYVGTEAGLVAFGL